MQSFDEDVIEASKTKPVLVDFWAPWCGPCRMLGPVLDRVAADNREGMTLVKVNTDEHPEISQQYGIRGIPAVKLFVDGAVSAEFTGALPEHEVRRWLSEHLPTSATPLLTLADEKEQSGDTDAATDLYRKALAEDPGNPQALARLAQLIVFKEPDQALEFINKAVGVDPRLIHLREPIETFVRLMQLDRPEENSESSRAYHQAISALRESDYPAAVERFMDVLKTDRYHDDDGSRKACIAIFNLLGPDHEVTKKYRRTFDMLLY